MARPTKKQTTEEPKEAVTEKAPQTAMIETASSEVPSQVAALMRLYPQYKELWVTPKGFVHPVGVPEYLIKGAKLYNNKYFKQ